MFLKSLELNGFKSFADKTHIDFTDGITSLLGPNGCGKSNIVDSIKWVLGEQSTKTLRASRMDDVIFSGTESRKPSSMAEVTLTIDNEDRNLQTDVPEIQIRRRLFRTGESEYYINGQRCLLKNIKDLFLDTGVGKSAYSILEQGKIDQILSNKPEDRRYIFEEAAGISRFKVKCNEAQNRINRADENINQLTTVLSEVKRTYDRTKNQAAKALKWQELKDRAFNIDVDIKLNKLNTFLDLKEYRIKEGQEAEKNKSELEARLSTYDDDISLSSSIVIDYQEKSKNIEISIGRFEGQINTTNETIALLKENYSEYLEKYENSKKHCASIEEEINQSKVEIENLESSLELYQERLTEKKEQLSYAENTLFQYRAEISKNNELIKETEEKNSLLDKELQDLSEELKNVIESLIKEVDENTTLEYSAKRKDDAESSFLLEIEESIKFIENRLSFLLSLPSNLDYSKDIATKDYNSLLLSFASLKKKFDDYKASIPPVIDTILSPEGLVSKKRAIVVREDNARDTIINNRKVIEKARIQIDIRNNDIASLLTTISSYKESIGSLSSTIENQLDNIKRYKELLEKKELQLEDERDLVESSNKRLLQVAEKINNKNAEKNALSQKIKELNEELSIVNQELGDKNRALNEKRREKEDLIRRINECEKKIDASRLYVNSIEDDITSIYTNFFDTYSHPLQEFEDRYNGEKIDENALRKELDSVNNEIKNLGNINHAAKEEFDQAEDQYKFYTKQLDDLDKAKKDMESVLGEILDKSKELFLASYKEISDNFQAMFKRLFGGGRAELSLTEPEDVLNSGIEILAQPPGKAMSALSLLSGGERSMTAVALLFATYQVKPSPFCVLDEIDAALDDRNIGYFLDVLQDFSRESQFIIITHNTHTVTGGNAMLGVSQMEPGVSTAVSYRIAAIEGQPRILDDSGSLVEFDEEGRKK